MSEINCAYCWGRHDENADCILRYQGQIRELQSQLVEFQSVKDALGNPDLQERQGLSWAEVVSGISDNLAESRVENEKLQSQLDGWKQEAEDERDRGLRLGDEVTRLQLRLDGFRAVLTLAYEAMKGVRDVSPSKTVCEVTDKIRDALRDEAGQREIVVHDEPIPIFSVYDQYCWEHGEGISGRTGGVYLKTHCPECSPADVGQKE